MRKIDYFYPAIWSFLRDASRNIQAILGWMIDKEKLSHVQIKLENIHCELYIYFNDRYNNFRIYIYGSRGGQVKLVQENDNI